MAKKEVLKKDKELTIKENKGGKMVRSTGKGRIVTGREAFKSGKRIAKQTYTLKASEGKFILSKGSNVLMSIGKRTSDNIFEIIDSSRAGLSYKEFDKVKSKLNLTNEDWCKVLNISERTLQRYNKEQKSFDSLQSEKIYEIAMLFDFGVSVFNSEEKFLLWLNYNNLTLGNVKPKSLFDTTFGIDLVKNELHKIEHGILA